MQYQKYPENQIQKSFQQGRLLFYGSRVNTLPYRIFALYKVLRATYGDIGALLPEYTHGNALYNEEDRCYLIREENGADRILTRSDTVWWISRVTEPADGRRFYILGMSRDPEDADLLHSPCQLALPADNVLNHAYRILEKFRRANPHKFVLPSARTNDSHPDPLQDLVWLPACPSCPEFRSCDHILCVSPEHYHALPQEQQDRLMRRTGLLSAAAGRTGPVAVIDLEMQDDYPMQFAGLLLTWNGSRYIKSEEIHMYIRLPDHIRISPYVSKLTGITKDFLAQKGIPEAEAAAKIDAFLSKASVICGQTPGKDFELMHLIYERSGLEKPACLQSGRFIDVAILIQSLYDNPQLLSLEKEADLMRVSSHKGRFHDAVTDTDVTADLFIRLFPLFILYYQREPVFDLTITQKTRSPLMLERLPGNTTPSRQKRMAAAQTAARPARPVREKQVPARQNPRGSRQYNRRRQG